MFFEVQMNEGGGQFHKVTSGHTTGGLTKASLDTPGKGSDIRVIVTKGQGAITWFDRRGY